MSRSKISRLTFIGEPSFIPDVGEAIQLHAADGSWQHGFRCISGPIEGDVWVCREQEWADARRETRPPKGDKWPLKQIASA
jgi:hypothetical protein